MKDELALPRVEDHKKLGQVCTTISARTAVEMVDKAQAAFDLGSDLVEFRVDLAQDSLGEMAERMLRFARKSIITVRCREEGGKFRGSEAERLEAISELTRLRPAYLDIELSTAREHPLWYAGLPRSLRKIVSWHDFAGTPSLRVLRQKRAEARELGQVTKIVTTAKGKADNLRVLKLYEDDPQSLIAFCMGSQGSASRLASLRLGAPVVYASLPGEPVAPGQLSVTTVTGMKRLLEEGRW
ncbi:MAG: type I 3-dehydroquinate dehydratase [Nitrososphaerota archaeon]|nr:type I 3-dehydroquinate dehydratase [Nitrososphaerota archaeon]